jgi:glycosyltransferase involved in cell wall biosynthesis
MQVVQLETGRRVYGGARQVLLLARGLQARGVSTTLVCTAGGAVEAAATRAGLPTRPVPMGGDLDLPFVRRFARLLGELSPDLVHVHSRRGGEWLGGRGAARAGVPALLTRRVDRPVGGLLAGLGYRPYRHFVAISAHIRRQLEAAGVSAQRITLIRSAVDAALVEPNWSRERLAREFQLDPGQLLVGCIAQLIPRKGHDILIRAWREVAAACPAARLLLFGQGPLERRLRRAVRTAGVAGSVVFAGFREDLGDFLGRLDLVVHPALEEGLGLAVLEAQAAGVPVVAFRAGGVPEIVADGRSGYLVAAGDAPALAIAMTELLQNADRRRAFAEYAWQFAAREARVADMIAAHLTLYRRLLETPAQ